MIEIKNLCKSYGQKRIYKNLNLSLQEKCLNGIVGPSGCGKTTLLRILAGLEGYEAGCIQGMEGQVTSLVFQEDRLMPWLNVTENIGYVLQGSSQQEREEKIQWALQLLKIEHCATSRLQSLSGGMR